METCEEKFSIPAEKITLGFIEFMHVCSLMDSYALENIAFGKLRQGDKIPFDKFVNDVKPGGKVFYDSTLIENECTRTDIDIYAVPSSQLADDNELKGGSNIVLLGKVLKETELFTVDVFKKAIEKIVPPAKAQLITNNFKAFELGMNA